MYPDDVGGRKRMGSDNLTRSIRFYGNTRGWAELAESLWWQLDLPKRHDKAADYDEGATDEDWSTWGRTECDEIDDLPDHEKRSDIEPNDAVER